MANYIDSNWFPEGTQRCPLPQFLLWIGFWALVLAAGLVTAGYVFYRGLITTGLDNYFAFGLWITFDLAIIALGAGAFFSGFLKYIVKIDALKNIINLTVVLGFLCYSGAMLILTLEIGQPLRAWFGYWHANVHSMLLEVIFCISIYLGVLIIEVIPLIFEQKQLNRIAFLRNLAHNFHVFMPLFAGIGAFLSTFHQGSLGGMYGVMFARPFAFREGFFIWPWTFFLFVLSAAACGPCFTVLINKLMEMITGRKLTSWSTKKLMGMIAGTMLAVYLFLKFVDTYAWIVDILPRAGLTFDQNFHGLAYGKWLLVLELGVCGIVPLIILLSPKLRDKPALFYTACILNCVGISLNRYIFTVQTLAMPVLPFDEWQFYLPNWVEWLTTIMSVAYGVLLMSIAYRYLPIFPQEVQLNAPPESAEAGSEAQVEGKPAEQTA